MKPNTKIFLLIIMASFFLSNNAVANSGIPGPIIWAAGSLTVSPLQWVATTMFMCVGVEGAIYHYLGLFKRPITASLIANIVSLILGIPLSLLGVIDPTIVVLPTIISILSEGLVLRLLPASVGLNNTKHVSNKKFWCSVIGANVLTNLVMLMYLFWAIHRA